MREVGLLWNLCRDAYYPYPYMSSILVIPIYTHRHPLVAVGEVGTPTDGTYTVKTTMGRWFYERVYYRYVCGRLSAAPAVTARRVVGRLSGPAYRWECLETPYSFVIYSLHDVLYKSHAPMDHSSIGSGILHETEP